MAVADQSVGSWRNVLGDTARFETPFYALWDEPFSRAVDRAKTATAAIDKTRHWYSYKSQPVPAMARRAAELGMGIEVVSPFELFAAHRLGFAPPDILVNGLAKHRWLRDDEEHLNVIFDSVNEVQELASKARLLHWRCGLRVAVSQQINADAPQFPAQFGLNKRDVGHAARFLRERNVEIDILHFHLRSNVADVLDYRAALEELHDLAVSEGLEPRIIDIGGGLPDTTLPRQTSIPSTLSIDQLGPVATAARTIFPDVEEVWLENGRALLAPAGVLVVSVLDIKERDGYRILICDGGRANHALPSDWETHPVALARTPIDDSTTDTLICGPTCMAFDSFYQGQFAADVRTGDRIIYFSAGAYHIPWETRFSFGECRVLWIADRENISEVRKAEAADKWLGRWNDI